MSTYLYRLGRWCATHAWATILAWVLIIAGAGGAMATLATPLSTEFSIPGTEFQRVLANLKSEIPEAAGGTGTVTFQSTDGKAFTPEQRKAISGVVKEWDQVDGVMTAIDPFAMQRQIDGGPDQIADGQKQINDGRAKIAAAQKRIDAGQKQIDDALASGIEKKYVYLASTELQKGRDEIFVNTQKLDAAQARLEVGRRNQDASHGMRFVTQRGDVAFGQVIFTDAIDSVPPATKQKIPALGASLADQGIEVNYSSDLTSDFSSIIGPGEILGLVIAAIVLLVMLGSLLAAGLPLLTALVGVAVGLMAALSLSHWVTMNDITPALALMLGLAVGIDYSLFLVHRHRQNLAHGLPLIESIGRAVGTSGNAVVVAGMTVFVALAALVVTGIPFLGTMGLVAAATVAIAVLVALTLTPALLTLLGHRVLSRRSRRRLAAAIENDEHTEAMVGGGLPGSANADAKGWGGLITTHPHIVLATTTVLLLLLSLPLPNLRLGLPDGSTQPAASTGYKSYATINDNFGPGANGAIIAVGTLDAPTGTDDLNAKGAAVAQRLSDLPGVAYVVPVGSSADRDTIAYQIVPTTGPSEQATVDLVNRLRSSAAQLAGATGLDLGFTGKTVANIDISATLASALPRYLAIVVGISMILLLLVFRSILVPLIATGGFLLSLTASFGAVVAVYQWGWLGPVFGVEHPGPVLSFLPIIVTGVLFGLAMDYQMFLVTGMREAWAHGQPAKHAVRTGFRHGAGVVTAAALIMAAVFAGFIHAQLTMIRPIGFALATGVLIDAFLVRMTATPAAMYILGEKAWYLPRWLDRILPDLDVEGAKLQAERERAMAADAGRSADGPSDAGTTGDPDTSGESSEPQPADADQSLANLARTTQ
ncbi:MMPL family transporter [Kribbia dieselivorans]|uniref:MMPL family transporter n=1 Tax=Kribbia dieselivorans TaxID=331526 RepID=UPI0009FB0DE2|nr:MMPL family transporter [Kribbia dieselivorans]